MNRLLPLEALYSYINSPAYMMFPQIWSSTFVEVGAQLLQLTVHSVI
jgi:hypothetical protein